MKIDIDNAVQLKMNQKTDLDNFVSKNKVVLFNLILFFNFQIILEKNKFINRENLKNKKLIVPGSLKVEKMVKTLQKLCAITTLVKSFAKALEKI